MPQEPTSPEKAPPAPAVGSRKLHRGQRLGKYRLDRRLGEGGYSQVWKAKDMVENIWVALKIPSRGPQGEPNNEDLLKEARLSAQLHHPHLLPPKNADIIDGQAVMATELSAGTLADRSKPMSPRKLVAICAQVLDGLAHAHRHRLVHCDVTPYNVFLFPDGRAALGDFGIGLRLHGRQRTVDEYGTPGYVAPEQAFGRPTYRSDCFSVGLIMYEWLTGVLPRWPFQWPFRGHDRLEERSPGGLVRFLRKALEPNPARRFVRAEEMLAALLAAVPEAAKALGSQAQPQRRPGDWRKLRREAFAQRYGRVLGNLYACVQCGEPVSEEMTVCPWCSSEKNRFDSRSPRQYVCPRCGRGVLPEWRYCPWCWGPGFKDPADTRTPGVRYHGRCKYCHGRLQRWMRYCPWCHRKVSKPWQLRPFPETCARCHNAVDSTYWRRCPWCGQCLVQ